MNIASIRPSSLDGIKSLAKKLKQQKSISHTEALEAASKQAGYESFLHARRSLSTDSVSPSFAGFPVYLTAHWYQRRPRSLHLGGSESTQDASGRPLRAGRELLQVNLTRPLPQIVARHRVSRARGLLAFVMEYDDHLEMHSLSDSQENARWRLLIAERALRFMDCTGLQPVSQQVHRDRLRPLDNLPGNDHTSNWFDPISGAVAMLDEPYPAALQGRITERDFQLSLAGFSEVPLSWGGIHNPGVAKPYLISTDSALLARVASAVASLPQYEFPSTWLAETGSQGDAFISPQRSHDGKSRRPIPNASYMNHMGATPYGGGFGHRSSWRPLQPMAPALHMELGAILGRLTNFNTPWKIWERLHTNFRSELENWADAEHPGKDVGYEAYYGQVQMDRFKTRQQHVAGTKRAKEIVVEGYNECKPKRELIAAIDAYAAALAG